MSSPTSKTALLRRQPCIFRSVCGLSVEKFDERFARFHMVDPIVKTEKVEK